MKPYYIGLDSYDKDSIQALCGCPQIKGIVLGDLLCTKRMFAGGIAEEIRMLVQVMESGKELLYQTPLYVTNRNWDEVFSVLEMLKTAEQKVHVITEDMGVVTAVCKEYPQMRLVWGRMGRDRAYRHTDDLLRELKRAGITGMETENLQMAGRLAGLGITPYLVYGNLHYQTVGRVCYTKYQTGTCDRASCLKGDYSLKEKDGTFEMSVDGYLMGKKFHYGNLEEMCTLAETGAAKLTVYAGSLKELQNCVKVRDKEE